MDEKAYRLGTWGNVGKQPISRGVTFVLTQDCNLACGYCYQTHKNRHSRMTWETAKRAVDWLLAADFPEDGVVFEFIGGEPTLEVELMDQICDYIKIQLYLLNHKWLANYSFTMSTNGVLYATDAVQRFIQKNKDHLGISISIDGTKEKHDSQRRFKNGEGSYDIVENAVKLWVSQFPSVQTKVTISSEDLPYLKESIVHLWNLGIKNVPANVVYEDVWKEGDDLIFEQQLREIADYALENNLWQTHLCFLFSDQCGIPVTAEFKSKNWCGTGKNMTTIDHEGKIYPCLRFMGYSLDHKEPITIGNIETGIDPDRLRRFQALDATSLSSEECLKCPISGQCAWCQGLNYDIAETDTVYHRATFICKMHKARVRANDYYFARLAKLQGERHKPRRDLSLYFILGDDAVSFCDYKTPDQSATAMSPEVYEKGLAFAAQNFYFPILLQPKTGRTYELPDGIAGWHAVSAGCATGDEDIVVYDDHVADPVVAPISILQISKEKIDRLPEFARALMNVSGRTVLVVKESHRLSQTELEHYEAQLAAISNDILSQVQNGKRAEFSVLTDRIWLDKMDNCRAGAETFALAPNGLLYICPAFYYANPGSAVGSLEAGIDWKKVDLCRLEKAPLCRDCQAYHCRRCVFDNLNRTGELNVPGRAQCVTSHLELRQTAKLRELGVGHVRDPITVDFLDPLERILSSKGSR